MRVAFDDDQGAPARFDLCSAEGHLGQAKAMGRAPCRDHVGHCMANLGMLAYFERHRPDLDDRRPPPPAAP